MVMLRYLPVITLLLLALPSCSMLSGWKSIPAPGGCSQCHQVEIAANWSLRYQPVILSDERGSLPFQAPQYNEPVRKRIHVMPIESENRGMLPCFECHQAPTAAHFGRRGCYRHTE